MRDPTCVEKWPECAVGKYDPRCCRFPKSCSCWLPDPEDVAFGRREQQKHIAFMEVARTIGSLSTCDRKQVGAVITLQGRCVTWGFNGAPPGIPHCSETWHGWQSIVLRELEDQFPGFSDMKDPDDEGHEEMYLMFRRSVEEKIVNNGCKNATHAEANALAFAARQGISTDKGTLYVTVSPCLDCARLIIAAGIREVWYNEQYRDTTGVELLKKAGVRCQDIALS